MRILAIRGKNLASLADGFAIDFETEPIRSAGIFAITGPTGAGKTTLLDAICLALFDSLPRMDGAERSAAIGRVDADSGQRVKYDDVRGILRHGAGDGYAEVDFVGQDGRPYRARWEVNRARRRANGRLQEQKITLTDITSGAIIGDKKTDTLQQIEKRIGLSFDQFRRSVLLAQGDFDTFIKAGPRDRAELLEKITGTEIYSQLSQAAFARAKQEREALRELETQLGEHQPLNAEERVAAEARVAEAKLAVDCIEAEKMALDKALDWYEIKSRLETRVAEGEAILTQAFEADQAAEADRATLTVVLKAFALRAELEAAAATGEKLAAAEKALVNAIEAERQAIEKRDQAIITSHTARAERDEQRAAYEAIGPELDQAQRLDTMIEAARDDLATQKRLLDKSIAEQEAMRHVIAEAEAFLRSARHQREQDARWLVEHHALEALSVRLEDVAKDLSERLMLERDITSTADQIAGLTGAVKAAETARLEQETALASLHELERELDERIAVCRKIADAIDVPALELKCHTMTTIQAALNDAQDAAGDAGKAHAGMVTADEEAASQHLVMRQAGDMIAQVDAELPTDRARLEEARRSLDLSEAAGSEAAERLRLKLEDGQPCPVCGATEHPITAVDRLLKERVSADRQRVTGLEAKVSTAQVVRTRAETQIAAAQEALRGIARRKSDHETELQTAHDRWRASVATMLHASAEIDVAVPTFAEDAAAAEADATIGPFCETLDTRLGEAKATMKRAADAEAEARKLASERETVRAGHTAAREDIQKLKDQEHTKAGEAAMLTATLRGLEQHLAAVYSRLNTVLAPVFPDWPGEIASLGADFIEVCRGLVVQWGDCRTRIETAMAEIARLEAELEGKRATLKAAGAAVGEAEQRHGAKQAALDTLVAARVNVIGGRPVGDVRTAYRERAEAAETTWSEAERARSTAEQMAAAMSSNAVSARHACNMAKTDHASAEQCLAEKLQACKMTKEEAESAIARGETWIAAEQARLDSLREAVATARATLTERQRSAQEHEAAGRPEHTREEIAAVLTDIEARRAKAAADFIEASSALHHDDQAHARMAEIRAILDERREKARVWGQLDELIGSADGTKFRRFAQSLTLSHLIHLANRHLTDLYPRYELQRAPGSDLVLQVIDHNMADEVRGVHNLSGGERFLISLALALGLASMSSSRGIKVGSLFIDEGFGTLDSTSLAMAVSVLEQLQATGRRVGVISHVDELKERIAVKVEVTPAGGGRSTVKVTTA
jgi:DNA repair protein SbcC/Rad50